MFELAALISSIVGIITILVIAGKSIRWLVNKAFGRRNPESISRDLALKTEFENNLTFGRFGRLEGEVIIRDVRRLRYYPDEDKSFWRTGAGSWYKAELKSLYHNGIEVIVGFPEKFANDPNTESWHKADEGDTLAYKVGRIPFQNIVNVDWVGDDHYDTPIVYCQYRGILRTPYERLMYYIYRPDLELLWPLDEYDPVKQDFGPIELWWLRLRAALRL